MVCLKETVTDVRVLEELALVLGEMWLCRRQVHTNSQPQHRWSASSACVLEVEGGKKKLCKKRSKKGINTLQSKILGRKKLLIANNLNMS